MKKVLLISNRVMHYRVSIYNYFCRMFKEYEWDFIVRSNELQKKNPHILEFDFREVSFKFLNYTREIKEINPDIVICFLHLRDIIIWPLALWLKFKKIPVIFWTKGLNLDNPTDKFSFLLYKCMHAAFDRIILYSQHEVKYIKEKHRHKIYAANNTLNFEDFPEITESKEQIKKDLDIPFQKIVLSVGRMDEGGGRKKIDHLIEVFTGINLKEVGLVIVGSGMNNGLLEKMNKENTLYLGEIYDPQHLQISRIFKMADVFSLPGHVGLGLVQAFYWGLPVVTEDGNQPPEIHYLVNGRNGFIVRNGNLSELKEKLLYLLQNDEVRKEFSANARNDIVRDGSIHRMFLGFKGCIDSLK